MPGITGITARVDGTDRSGTLRLRAEAPAFDWPRLFRAPIRLERAAADVRWKRDGAAWVISTRQASLAHAQAKAQLDLEFKYLEAGVSPVLNMTATVEDIDVTGVPQFLPVGRMNPRTIAWLDGAFGKGRAGNGKLSYRGPVKRFPFRNGEGDFTASVEASDITLDYFPGFAPLTMAEGTAEFHNASIGAKLSSGRIAGLKLASTEFRMSDYKSPVLDIVGSGNGDLGRALVYVQESPLGPRLGTAFMGLSGSGPARYAVKLLLPIMARNAQPPAAMPRKMDYEVRADLDAVTVASTVLRAPAQAVTGKFTLHNQEISLDGVRGTFLDGPFELTASPGRHEPRRACRHGIHCAGHRGRRALASIHRVARGDPHGRGRTLGTAWPRRKAQRLVAVAGAARRQQHARGSANLRAEALRESRRGNAPDTCAPRHSRQSAE